MHSTIMYEDILFLVLCFLPPKASARFKSVSKYWNRLICSSPYIQSLHKCCADSKRVIGFYHGSKTFNMLQVGVLECEDNEQDVQAVFSQLAEKEDIYGSAISATCNGFFLLDYSLRLMLRNPLTGTNVRVPLPPQPDPDDDTTRLIYFGLDVSSSSSKQGGNINLVFKILNINICRKLETSLCSIYSSLTGLWTPLEMDDMVLKQFSGLQDSLLQSMSFDPYPSLNPVGATSLRRSLHWLYDDGRIFAFDLEARTWRHMETPAARGGKRGVRLIKNHFDIISDAVGSIPIDLRFDIEDELISKLICYLYPNIWLGSVGEHIYLLLVIDGINLQLWILDNYDEVEWRIIVDIKDCGSVAPLFFDGRRIFVADFDFGEWKNRKGVIRFFDIFTRKWLPNNFMITKDMDQIRFFFARIRPRTD